MSDYKKIMGYETKKKYNKKSNKSSVIDNIKKELNEWSDTTFRNKPKRWSGASDKGLTEYEKQLSEGPAYEYRKPLKDVETDLKNFSGEVLNFYELLRGKGLDKEATYLLNNIYKKHIIGFSKEFKKFARKLM